MTRRLQTRIFISAFILFLCQLWSATISLRAQEYRVYVDDLWQVTDEAQAQRYFYSWQHLGEDRWMQDYNNKKDLQWTSPDTLPKGKPVPASGELMARYRNGRTYLREHYCEGRLCKVTECFHRNGLPDFTIDYDKRWQGRPWSYYIEWYKKGEVTKSAFMYLDTENHRWVEICTMGCQKNTALFHPEE